MTYTSYLKHHRRPFLDLQGGLPLACGQHLDFRSQAHLALGKDHKGLSKWGVYNCLAPTLCVFSNISDANALGAAKASVSGTTCGNYAFSVAALNDETQAELRLLFVPFRDPFAEQPLPQKVAAIASHFASRLKDKPMVTDAKGSDLASVLLLASLNNRSVRVTDVCSKEDLLLISLNKAKQLKVTCDISVYSLFYGTENFGCAKCLPSREHLDVIDAFLAGIHLFELALEHKSLPHPPLYRGHTAVAINGRIGRQVYLVGHTRAPAR